MGGKRRAQTSGDAQGKGAVGDEAAAQGGASGKRSMQGADGAGSCGQEESGSILAPVSMCFSMRCNPSALAGRKAALAAAVEAALMSVVAEFGGQEVKVERMRVGPSEDTLQRMLPLVLERVGPEGGARCFLVCHSWKRELEPRGFCNKTVQLCSILAEGGDTERLFQNVQRRLDASTDVTERAMCLDASALMQRSLDYDAELWEASLPEWLQAASQEPDASFLSRGAASTSEVLGLPLVRWIGKPQGLHPGLLGTRKVAVDCVAFSADGTRVVTGSHDGLMKIWDVETGAEVGHSGVSEILRVVD